ncbi:MAG: bL27 family ribosomal protein, partial [Endomicrobium sp.]|nr:bL27 family ribosomal protein [Endomicrobium sp.]
DNTLFAKRTGIVKFIKKSRNKRYVNVICL